MKFTIAILILFSLDLSLGKIYTQCELANELSKLGMDSKEIQMWVCIANIYRVDVNKLNSARKIRIGGHSWHGIFHIHKHWCSIGRNPAHGRNRNICNIPCSELRTDDITASVNCARKIYTLSGDSYKYYWGDRVNTCTELTDLNQCTSSKRLYDDNQV